MSDPIERALFLRRVSEETRLQTRRDFSNAIADAMQEGVSAVELAKALGVSKQRVYAIVSEFAGEREQPKPKHIHHRSMPDREPVRELESTEIIESLDEVARTLERLATIEAVEGLTESPKPPEVGDVEVLDGLDACDEIEKRLLVLEDRWERLVDAVQAGLEGRQRRDVSEALLLDCLAYNSGDDWAAGVLAELEEAFALRQQLSELAESGA